MIQYTQTLDISSLCTLYFAYLCEQYFWIKTHNRVTVQARQLTQNEYEKRKKQRNECFICFVVFVIITFLFCEFANFMA